MAEPENKDQNEQPENAEGPSSGCETTVPDQEITELIDGIHAIVLRIQEGDHCPLVLMKGDECIEGENLIKEYMPKQYNLQKELIQNNVIKKYQFGNLFTSSISNFNISADFHMDTKNIKNSVNIIINKKENANGGNLYIPDYDACIDCIDNSLTVYPAWKSLHGVTPIIPTKENGYRNSLVFYALTGLNK